MSLTPEQVEKLNYKLTAEDKKYVRELSRQVTEPLLKKFRTAILGDKEQEPEQQPEQP